MPDFFGLSIALIVIGVALVVLEIFQPGFFIAAIGSTVALIGVIGLVLPQFYEQGRWTILTVLLIGLPATGVNLWVYRKWAQPGTKPLTMAADSLPGEVGEVEVAIPAHGTGRIRVRGQSWRATSAIALEIGAAVRIVRVESLTAHVVAVGPDEFAP